MLEIRNLNVGYANAQGVLKMVCADLNLQPAQGSLTMLAGRNGSGKSSLLRSIAGLQKPLAGSVFMGGTSILDSEPPVIAALVSVMFSTPPNMELATVGEVVLTSMQREFPPFKTDFTEEWKRVESCLQVCGVRDFMLRRFESLSDGEKQKVMLARCLAQNTPVLLLDEPLAFLDYPSRREMLHLLRHLSSAEGKTIIYSSHDLDISLGYCDHLLLLKGNGRTRFYESAAEISQLKPATLFSTD